MITIIRTKRVSDTLPAGTIWTYSNLEVKEVCIFMWGKDIKNYLVFKDGFEVELDSDMSVFEKRLKET